LQFVVYLSRHGVRSPTDKNSKYNAYSSAPWPEWTVPPGYLTAHGYRLMTIFGAYDRARLAADGLWAPTGCADAAHVSIVADSDQRTRETGKALAEGMFPGCTLDVQTRPEGVTDPLFHSMHDGVAPPERALAAAAVAGRIGGDPNDLTEAYRPQLSALDKILSGCGRTGVTNRNRVSLFDVPTIDSQGEGDHAATLRGPLTVASTLSENLLLEFTEGMAGTNLGWGCLDESALRHVMQLHTAAADLTHRTPFVARMSASNLLAHILMAMEQNATGQPVLGAPGKPGDRALFLVGHDTNIATVAGALRLNWVIDGRRDDTPPGGALVFSLWRSRADGKFLVRVNFTAQTLDQMRNATALTVDSPLPQAPVFVPTCSRQDLACTLEDFASAVHSAIDPAYIKK
jgi:4-phytase/acid phosphatase